jgi:capsular polysaccharide transport system permease protein
MKTSGYETVSQAGWQSPRRSATPAAHIGDAAGAVPLGLWRRRPIRWLTLLLPSILAAVYYLAIATDQYESEVRFVVRTAAKPSMPDGLSFLMQLGFGRSQDDSFIVQEFMTSRDAIEQLKARLPLPAMFDRQGADFLARYPSLIYGPEEEEFYRYFQRMVTVVHSETTGISTLTVRTFRPEDSRAIAEVLLGMGEDLVNRINARLQTDAVASGVAELNAGQQRLIAAQTAVTEFRNRELTVDPERNAVALAELIAQLSSELAFVRAQIAEMKSGSAGSPQLPGLQRKAAALEQQIAEERRRIANDTEGLARRLADHERLQLEREFARRLLTSAEAELMRARQEASRQLLYLERIVEPHSADYSTQPKRLRLILTVLTGNLVLLLVGWLIWSGIREHAPHLQ